MFVYLVSTLIIGFFLGSTVSIFLVRNNIKDRLSISVHVTRGILGEFLVMAVFKREKIKVIYDKWQW